MSRVYIAATLPLLPFVKELANGLRERGLEVVSTWHEGEPSVEAERRMGGAQAASVASQCFADIDEADALVLLYGEPTERHGSFVELGYALGKGKAVLSVYTGLFPLPTILLLDSRVRRASLDLATLGAARVAWDVLDLLRGVKP